jgi:hypothetical protein
MPASTRVEYHAGWPVAWIAYVWSGNIALPLGIHITWGYFEEFIFGYANRGRYQSIVYGKTRSQVRHYGQAEVLARRVVYCILLAILVDVGLVFSG